ncbi:VOC family protein [Bacillus salitolerans]|uniref:VOC family protein n=1 Tax=Bacillus salitolerans TaxID=1437434 RepID=A0ABW4LK49_9BACI
MIHHIELYVSDLTKSLSFWDWFLLELGYVAFQEWEKGKSYKIHNMYLVFVQTREKYLHMPYHRCGIGLNHLAFHASSREQVDLMTKAVKDRGMNVLYEDKHPFAGGKDYYALFFEDPDRIKVELVAPGDQVEEKR